MLRQSGDPNAQPGQAGRRRHAVHPRLLHHRELYDLQNDPHEAHNLAADPKQAAVLDELKAKLKAFQKRTRDPWILKWEYE